MSFVVVISSPNANLGKGVMARMNPCESRWIGHGQFIDITINMYHIDFVIRVPLNVTSVLLRRNPRRGNNSLGPKIAEVWLVTSLMRSPAGGTKGPPSYMTKPGTPLRNEIPMYRFFPGHFWHRRRRPEATASRRTAPQRASHHPACFLLSKNKK